MDFLHILILAVVQALTEFLPISSSAHLYLASVWFGWDYQGLTFDLGLHLGTLLAVIVYYRRDLSALVVAGARFRPGRPLDDDQRLLLGLLLATIPGGLAALAMTDALQDALRNLLGIGLLQIAFGLLLGYADRRRRLDGEKGSALGLGGLLLVGCAQALALMPGVSRSGVTLTAAMLLGLSRVGAARVSFLLAVPITALASAKGCVDVWIGHSGGAELAVGDFLVGAAISAVAGYLVIAGFLSLLRHVGVAPFVWYRLALGVVLVTVALLGG